jgi:hypothetical protein
MAHLHNNPLAEWTENITEIQREDPVLGGHGGPVNEPHKELADRTEYLRRQIGARETDLSDVTRRIVALEEGVQSGESIPDATEDTAGKVRYASIPETQEGLVTDKAVTPAGLAAMGYATGTYTESGEWVPNTASTTNSGIVRLATEDEIRAGEAEDVAITPAGLRSMGFITFSGGGNGSAALVAFPAATTSAQGVVRLATTDETHAGTANDLAVTPASLKAILPNTWRTWNTASNLSDISAISGMRIGDCIVNTGSATRNILGVSTVVGGIVQSTGNTTGVAAGNIRGAQGESGSNGSNGNPGASLRPTTSGVQYVTYISGANVGDYAVNTGSTTISLGGIQAEPGDVVRSDASGYFVSKVGNIRGVAGADGAPGVKGDKGDTGSSGFDTVTVLHSGHLGTGYKSLASTVGYKALLIEASANPDRGTISILVPIGSLGTHHICQNGTSTLYEATLTFSGTYANVTYSTRNASNSSLVIYGIK